LINNKQLNKNMKTIEIQDQYTAATSSIKVDVADLNEQEQISFRETHMAIITANQIAKLTRELPNGAKNLNVTKQDSLTGKATEAEIYFSI